MTTQMYAQTHTHTHTHTHKHTHISIYKLAKSWYSTVLTQNATILSKLIV